MNMPRDSTNPWLGKSRPAGISSNSDTPGNSIGWRSPTRSRAQEVWRLLLQKSLASFDRDFRGGTERLGK